MFVRPCALADEPLDVCPSIEVIRDDQRDWPAGLLDLRYRLLRDQYGARRHGDGSSRVILHISMSRCFTLSDPPAGGLSPPRRVVLRTGALSLAMRMYTADVPALGTCARRASGLRL